MVTWIVMPVVPRMYGILRMVATVFAGYDCYLFLPVLEFIEGQILRAGGGGVTQFSGPDFACVFMY
jgi:hypothetical protein